MTRTIVVHCKRSAYDIYIGRGQGSKWGNPFSHRAGTQAKFVVPTIDEAIRSFEDWIRQQPELMEALSELKGKILGCWCKPGPCHGDVLARLADALP